MGKHYGYMRMSFVDSLCDVFHFLTLTSLTPSLVPCCLMQLVESCECWECWLTYNDFIFLWYVNGFLRIFYKLLNSFYVSSDATNMIQSYVCFVRADTHKTFAKFWGKFAELNSRNLPHWIFFSKLLCPSEVPGFFEANKD